MARNKKTDGGNLDASRKSGGRIEDAPVSTSMDVSVSASEEGVVKRGPASSPSPKPRSKTQHPKGAEDGAEPHSKALLLIACLAAFVAIALLVWGFALEELKPHQERILSYVLPLCGGLVAGAFTGHLTVKSNRIAAGLVATAAGGFGVWLLLHFFPPAEWTGDNQPKGQTINIKNSIISGDVQNKNYRPNFLKGQWWEVR